MTASADRYFEWLFDKERQCEPVVEWLNANHLPEGATDRWAMWQTGGGCTCYGVNIQRGGKFFELTVGCDSTATPAFVDKDEYPQSLILCEVDKDGDWLDIQYEVAVQKDMRDLFKPENQNWENQI